MSKKYLITGAAGFIGSFVAQHFIRKDCGVWTIDNLSTGYRDIVPEGVIFIEGGCQDQSSIDQLQSTRFDAILHIAGQSSGEVSFSDPVYDLRTNTESTLRLIDYGLNHGCERFIYASSMSVYGNVPDEPISEEFAPNPLSFYGVGKLASEHYLRIYQDRGLKPTVLRIFNVYGPNQNMENFKQGMVSIYLAQMLNNDKIIVKGNNKRFRDFIAIHDVVRFIDLILDNEQSIGGTYNVGTGVRTTVEQLLAKLQSISGIKREVVFDTGTPGDQMGIYADVSLIRERFAFQHQYDLEDGLKEMIDWAKEAVSAS